MEGLIGDGLVTMSKTRPGVSNGSLSDWAYALLRLRSCTRFVTAEADFKGFAEVCSGEAARTQEVAK